MNPQLRLLHLEDDPHDADLIRRKLAEEGFTCDVVPARNRATFEAALAEGPFDLVLSDYQLPDFDGLSALSMARDQHPHVPFILISGTLGEEQAVESLKCGATDYILKQRLTRLVPAVRRALKEAEVLAQRKEAEEVLRTSEERFRVTLKNSAIMVFNQDGELRYTWMHNPQFGRTHEDVLGKTDGELLRPEDAERLTELKRRVMDRGVGAREEVQITSAGKRLFYDLTVEPMRDAGGAIIGITGAAMDITEKKLTEAQFLRAQRLESVGALASGIAHDLNNILAPILMSVAMLRWGLKPEETEKTVSSIETSAQRGAELVKQLLTFGRGVEGQRTLIQPKHLLREIQKMARETFPKAISVDSRIPGDLWSIEADATQLHQVLLNLCVNARDAMPAGGTLTLAAANVSLDEHYSGMTHRAKAGPYVALQVTDTGQGISQEIMDKIFDPFFTTKEPGKGTGLGLSTVLGIVKSHGGFVDVRTEVDKGSAFLVYLPAAPGRQAAAAPVAPVEAAPGHGELVVVVDDEPQILSVTKRTLERNGYRVLVAEDGVAATVLFTRHQSEISVVLTDLEMPFMDGVAVVRALRKIAPSIRIIACTGLGSAQGLHQKTAALRELGVETYLAKPFVAQTLLSTLQKVLRPK